MEIEVPTLIFTWSEIEDLGLSLSKATGVLMSNAQNPTPIPNDESPHWERSTKIIAIVVMLLLSVWLAYRFQGLIAQLVIAAIFAYILNPIIILVDDRTTLNRGSVTVMAYLLVAAALIWALVALGVAAYEQISSLLEQVPALIDDLTALFQTFTAQNKPVHILGITIDPIDIPWEAITQQLLGLVEPTVAQGTQVVRQLATTTVGWVGNFFFIFVISIYIALEIPKLGGYVGDFAQTPGYRQDAERLIKEFGRIWSAYLRGQVILGLVIGSVVWIGLSILGVQNALALGILSGLLEFVPIIGPVIGAGAAIVVALFQPENYLGLVGWQYALAVLSLMLVIQQLENNILVPRIVGDALDLHPLLVMVAVFMGGSIAGILGAILAAPVTATLKLLGIYTWRKMFDLPPFPATSGPPPPPVPPLRVRIRKLVNKLWWQPPAPKKS